MSHRRCAREDRRLVPFEDVCWYTDDWSSHRCPQVFRRKRLLVDLQAHGLNHKFGPEVWRQQTMAPLTPYVVRWFIGYTKQHVLTSTR